MSCLIPFIFASAKKKRNKKVMKLIKQKVVVYQSPNLMGVKAISDKTHRNSTFLVSYWHFLDWEDLAVHLFIH